MAGIDAETIPTVGMVLDGHLGCSKQLWTLIKKKHSSIHVSVFNQKLRKTWIAANKNLEYFLKSEILDQGEHKRNVFVTVSRNDSLPTIRNLSRDTPTMVSSSILSLSFSGPWDSPLFKMALKRKQQTVSIKIHWAWVWKEENNHKVPAHCDTAIRVLVHFSDFI